MSEYAKTYADRSRSMVLRHPIYTLSMIMRGCAQSSFPAAISILLAAFFMAASPCRAQLGITAWAGGTLPTGEFGRTDLERTPPKSGAEKGHSFGGGVAWRVLAGARSQSGRGLHPDVIISLVWAESEFGNNVPRVLDDDTMQFVTPASRIRLRGLRAGVRVVPWAHRCVSPSFGGGFESGKMKVESRAFFGPGAWATGTDKPLALQVTSKSENISGVFAQLGVQVQRDATASFFADAVFHHLFSEGVGSSTKFSPGDALPTEGEIKSNFQWWEFRAGLVCFF